VRHLMAGTLPADAVALTFDDGYVDNLVAGKPRLAAADVPATVFLATGYSDRALGFWWDELARLILFGTSPRSFYLVVRGKSLHFDLGTEAPACENGIMRAVPLARRRAALTTIGQAIRPLADDERELIMVELRSIFAGCNYYARSDRAMSGEEVRALV